MRDTAIYAVLISASYAACDLLLHPMFGTASSMHWLSASWFSVMGYAAAKLSAGTEIYR